jgi:hypothetical protein
MSSSLKNRIAFVLAAALFVSSAPAGTPEKCATEPDVKTAMSWWQPPQNVWTPIGWKDHLFRFQVVYNGHLLCTPAGRIDKPHIQKYKGRDFQFNAYPSPDGKLPALPKEDTKVKLLDGGVGIQGWREDHEAPVLWTDFPRHEGVVLRQEVFGHMKGGGEARKGDEPLYAWVRLSVKEVDPLRAPEKFYFACQLSRVYYDQYGHRDDSLYLFANLKQVKLKETLMAKAIAATGDDGAAGMDVAQGEAAIRLRVLPGGAGTVSFEPTAKDSGMYNLKVELPVRAGAHTDILIPMLPAPADEIDAEAALGFDGALAQAETYWKKKPATAARIHTPEKYINDAIARNIQLAQIIAETNPQNGEVSFISGSYGYDGLWATPTSMVSHMFLDLLGYHDVTEQHARLFKKNQGTVRPPGPAYKMHAGYFSTPKTLTTIDWLTDHGAVLEQLSRHALLTGDQKFIDEWIDPIIKGCDFIKDACAATGHGGVEGVMPPAVATDTGVPSQAVWNEAWVYKGLTTSVALLKRLNHPRAAEFDALAKEFRTKFREAFVARAAKEPTWSDASGKQHPMPPTNLIPAAQHHMFDDAFYLDTGPLVLPWAGLLEADDPMMTSFADFFRSGPNTKLRAAVPSNLDRAVLDHEISSCEPCYSWNIVNSWKTGDRAHFLEGMYGLFTGAISPQTFVNCEHRHAMYGNVFAAPLMTWSLRQSVIDDQLAAGELHLLRLVPNAWVSSTEQTAFENMPTEYGPVDLKWRLSPDGKQLDVSFAGRWRQKPAKVVFHAPPIPGVTNILVNGEPIAASGSGELTSF